LSTRCYDLLPFYPSGPTQAGLTFGKLSIFVKESNSSLRKAALFPQTCGLRGSHINSKMRFIITKHLVCAVCFKSGSYRINKRALKKENCTLMDYWH